MKEIKGFEYISDKNDMLKTYSKVSIFFLLIPVAFVISVLSYSYYNSLHPEPSHDKIVSDFKKSRVISSDKKP